MEVINKIRDLFSIVKIFADQITPSNSNTERNTPTNREENTNDAVTRDTL